MFQLIALLTVFFPLMVLSAIICALVAVNVNRTAIGWGFLGFCFFLLPLLVLLSLPKVLPRYELLASGRHYEYRVCPQCAEPIRRQARKCIHCGTVDIEPPPTPPIRQTRAAAQAAALRAARAPSAANPTPAAVAAGGENVAPSA